MSNEPTWEGLDPDAAYYGWMDTSDGYTTVCDRTLTLARTSIIDWPDRVVVAFIDGQHRRVPDGDPPKPAPVVTVDGQEVEVLHFDALDPHDQHIIGPYDGPFPSTPHARCVAVIAWPEEDR